MAASRRKQDDKNLEILRELISQSGNKYCLDCNQRGPTYVNTTIGSFVCSKCSGMLRGLTPPHRVKSISMATFTPEEIEFIRVRGNDYCRRVWLGLYEGESVNYTDEQRVRDFMSDKYEKKQYYLESPPNNAPITNGSSSQKTKNKQKSASATVTAPLIAISPQISKSSGFSNVPSAAKVLPMSSGQDINHKIARPVNNHAPPLFNNNIAAPPAAPVQPPVPDFPVDFSTANIYNSAQNNNFSSNINNNFASQPTSTTTPSFNAFNSTSNNSANDRYAALADLDLVFRQQNMKNKEDNVISRNPFQSTNNDVFANKNPFFNGGWSAPPAAVPVNPFMPSNNGSFVNPKNPFL
ncbi:arf-GAP domain and FG repeat-containing protein 1 [Colias croceus]|uniref:arf-GAP domain and FG repeat-containing protein 1 n=1 Tax=Colias crocea TaxID=72248 RepID=UPI001E27E765|nr:arf-GAP domain and FG repeat-containing protein 1 [Colias croceus]